MDYERQQEGEGWISWHFDFVADYSMQLTLCKSDPDGENVWINLYIVHFFFPEIRQLGKNTQRSINKNLTK